MSVPIASRAAVKACHDNVVRLTREGWSQAEIAAEVGYSVSTVARIRGRYGVSDSRMLAKFKAFEAALSADMPVDEALELAGWGKAATAESAYYRHRRPVPRGLAKAAYQHRKAAAFVRAAAYGRGPR